MKDHPGPMTDEQFKVWRAKQPDQKTETGLILEALKNIANAIRNDYSSMADDIVEFHAVVSGDVYDGPPRELPSELRVQRAIHMQEELDEYIAATTLEEGFDALIDLVYVALGTAHLHGFPFEEGWERVHKANMKKIGTGKGEKQGVIKPEGWVAPYLKDLV